MNFIQLIKARKILNAIWETSWLKGRCWGPPKITKNKTNPYARSNITIAVDNELITISQNHNGNLKIHEFTRTQNTKLGNEIRKILKNNKIKISS